ncbi:DNA helicase, partial [Tanacetum coccineum]
MDTGASSHLAENTGMLTSFSNPSLYKSVFVGNGQPIPVTHTSHSLLHTPHKPLHLHHVLVTPNIIKNLIYVRQFTRDNNVFVDFDAYGFSVKDYQTRRFLLRCDSTGDLYPVTQQPSSTTTFDLLSLSPTTWHIRLGHPCKHTRLPFYSSESNVASVFDIIHFDLWTSPISSESAGISKPLTRMNCHATTTSPIPRSHLHALRNPNWHKAMVDEYNALISNGTWVLVPRPTNVNIVRSMWLFRHKYNADGSLSRYKARLVANGRSQQQGIDCDETFSPVVKPATICTVLSLAVSCDWPIHQLDVKNAFLHGQLSETVYIHQPLGFVDSSHPDYVCHLQLSLYRLKQAPRGSDIAYLLLYVDDIVLTALSTTFLQRIITVLHGEFAMTDLEEILKRAQMLHYNPCKTPVDTESKLGSDGESVSDPTLYRSLAGALQYLTFTRPDISYAVQQICLYMQDPRVPHFHALKRILRYVRGTIDHGLQLYVSSTSQLTAFTDADWASCPITRRSTSGYCVFLGDNLLSWSAKRQVTLSRSSAEAKYRGVANVVAEAAWIRNLLLELHAPLTTGTLVYCNNVSVVYLSTNPVQHQRTKHIEIDIHFVPDYVASGQVRVLYVPSRFQYADIFTKGLLSVLFLEFRSSLNVRRPPVTNVGVKRKLVPNSYPLSGDAHVVSSNVSHHVYDANSNASTKKRCLGDPNFISSAAIGVTSSGVRNMTNTNSDAVSNMYIGQPITMPHQSGTLPDTECKRLSHSVVPSNIISKSKDMTKPNADVTDGGNYASVVATCAQPEYIVPNSNNRSQHRRNRTRQNPHVNGDSSSQQPSSSGPPPEYKYLGGCTHSCEHCGALFWFEERLKRSSITSHPRSLCPADGEPPWFLQLYIYDTDNEVNNRLSHYSGDNSTLRRDIVEGRIDLLDSHNALVQLFRTTRKKFQDAHVPNFKVRLYNVVGVKEYELPTGDMLGTIVYETGPETDMDYDIVLEERSSHPQRVNKLHPSYMSLQFPLLFIYSEDGYSKDFKMLGSTNSSSEDRCLTMLVYYSYYLHDRANRYNYLSRTGKLFQQYVVTAFCAIEQNRIDFIREHQNDIRNEYLSGIYDAINRGDNDGFHCGSKLILPQSFTGGPRYMYSHYLDALAICRVHGNPSYFITFTCNVNWPEITEYMEQFPLLTTTDRADIVDRVFEIKIHQFVNYLRDIRPFGKVVVVLYTVEFQKRGLPHCHTLLWIDESVRVRRDENIEIYVSAELPSQHIDPQGLHIDDSNLEDYMLYEFETCLNHCSKSVTDFGLRLPPAHLMSVLKNRLLMEEKSYDRQLLATERDKLLPKLNENQRQIFNLIVNACLNNEQELVFVCGHGGTGKTFLWKTILYTLRCERKIVLAVASYGIASLLLPAGRTAHSRFKIPLDLTDTSVCAIKKNTQLADLLKETCLIVWDEAPMNDRRCFKTLDRTLRDILNEPDHLFGGKTVMLGGDFRQTLPVKRSASRDEIIRSSIANSYLWRHFKIHYLLENMRLNNESLSEVDKDRTTTFAQWLLNIGNGQIGIPDDSDLDNTSWVDIPDEYCIPNDDNGIPNLINFIYDAETLHYPSAEKLQEKAIICPKNDTANMINNTILSLLTTTTRTYLSYDDAIPHTHDGGEIELLYPKEYLNSLSFPGLPPHNLTLKVGSPIMLLRNMNIAGGLCNGTRLIVSQLLPKVIEARIITGTRINQKVFLPRILLTMKDPRKPFIFRRKQFPVKVCYAMTINKAQGQSLKKIGIYLAEPVFGHGQLYVALSRATTPDGLKILINSQIDKPLNTTKNIVYKDFLSQIDSQQ